MSGSFGNIVSKLLALGLLAGVVFAVVAGALLPVAARYQDAEQRLADGRQLLGRYLARSVTDVEAERDGQRIAPATPYLSGDSDALRLASLQAVLSEAAQAQGIRLASSRAMDASDRGGVRLLGVQVQLSTELDQLQKLLYDLEVQRPGLFVEQLHILRGPDGGTVPLPSLDVTFVVAGAAPSEKDQ